MKKVDKHRQTGSGGGKQCQFNEADELVLAIIGQKSPTMQGLGALSMKQCLKTILRLLKMKSARSVFNSHQFLLGQLNRQSRSISVHF